MISERNLHSFQANLVDRSLVNSRNSVLERYNRMTSRDIFRRPQNMVACSTGLSSVITQPNRIVLPQNQYGATDNGSRINTDTSAGIAPVVAEITPSTTVAGPLPLRSRLTNCCVHFYQSVDCTAACYFVIAIVMMIVGVVVTLATAKEKLVNDEAGTIAQLWIVGPIFVSSGLLVLIKSVSHVYKKMRRSMRHQLGNESRHSLRGATTFPPSYSRALVAPVPSNIVELDDDQISYCITKDVAVGGDSALTNAGADGDAASLQDVDSCKNVTIVCNDEPLPPSYTEAVEMIKRKSTTSSIGRLNSASGSVSSASRPPQTSSSKQHDVKDAATQIDLIETAVVVHQANDSAAQTNAVDAGASASLLFNSCVVGSGANGSAASSATQVVRKTRSDTNVALDAKSFSTDPNVAATQQQTFTGANEPCTSITDAGNSLVHM